ncbi:MAG TPA: helix-turn-helix domain-containing protein [Planctomycetota bacterium]|jgi:excisionase family DNA binding protein|nr:helix-turn-helix domain-containing protein [Planctomycetota bacterium]
MATEERWVDVGEVAKHIGVRRESIYRWIDKKGFPAHRAGRLLRFKLSEVDEWVRGTVTDSPGGRRVTRKPFSHSGRKRGVT